MLIHELDKDTRKKPETLSGLFQTKLPKQILY
jgi:hypothetical protein